MTYTVNHPNYVFASVFVDRKGSNVSIFEVDNVGGNGQFKLLESTTFPGIVLDDIADVIRPYNPNEVTNTVFIGTFCSKDNYVMDGLYARLKCRVKQLRPIKDFEEDLKMIPIRIGEKQLVVAPNLVGVIQADYDRVEINDIPHNIQAILQIMPIWNWLKKGAQPEPVQYNPFYR